MRKKSEILLWNMELLQPREILKVKLNKNNLKRGVKSVIKFQTLQFFCCYVLRGALTKLCIVRPVRPSRFTLE